MLIEPKSINTEAAIYSELAFARSKGLKLPGDIDKLLPQHEGIWVYTEMDMDIEVRAAERANNVVSELKMVLSKGSDGSAEVTKEMRNSLPTDALVAQKLNSLRAKQSG